MYKFSVDTLPQEFEFYGMGMVKSISEEPDFGPTPDAIQGIGYKISGKDPHSPDHHPWALQWMVLLVDQDQDVSMVSEIGNIIASRVAPEWTSPPVLLTPVQLQRLINHTPKSQITFKKNYGFFSNQGVVPIQLMMVSLFLEELGHA